MRGRRQAELDGAVSEPSAHEAVGVQGDIPSLNDLDRLYVQIDREHGQLDVLFANAGGGWVSPRLGEISEEQFDKEFDINVKGTLFTVQKAFAWLT